MTIDRFLIANPASLCIMFEMKRRRLKDIIDLTGLRFGKLSIHDSFYIDGKRGRFWNCSCDCGNKCVAYGGHLRAGDRKSCGCLHEVNIEFTGCKILFNITKRKCKQLNREFSLDLEQFSKLIKQNCVYCGDVPSQQIKRCKSKKTQIIYNGIDRVDSNLGYTKENSVTCCKKCNRSKSNLSIEEWKFHLIKVVNFMGLI